ncbi:MAG: alkaline phosphatase family protein [Chloroflexota bacterium]|nr:alkaline phosphatase family protein [Chloroflexota bacterium]
MQISNKVLIIGLDGATWDVLDPWIADGSLPYLAKLREEGSWGELRSSIPPITAAAWSTFMTGKRPGKHGLYHFIDLFGNTKADDSPQIVNARSMKSSTLWDILGHNDQKVGLINVPMTYPPRPINGFMVTSLLTPKNATVFTYPTELSDQLREDYIIDLDRFVDKKPFQGQLDSEAKRTTSETAPTLTLMKEFQEMLESRAKHTLSLIDSQDWAVFMVVFTGTDRMGHYLWPYHRSATKDDNLETQQLCQAVYNYYKRLDEIVGELLEKTDEDTTVIVMSDHGMGPIHTKRMHCNYWLQQKGWLTAKKEKGAGAINNSASLLHSLGLPRDKIGRLVFRIPGLAKSRFIRKAATSRSAVVDTEQSQAYCLPMYSNFWGIRINLKGEKKEALRQEIMEELKKITDPETGHLVVRQVYRGEDYYYGPYANNIPDIIVMMDPDYGCNPHLGRYSAPVTQLQVDRSDGDHRFEGIFVAKGSQIAANPNLPDLAIEDVAPTILYLMGLPVPTDMDGRVLTEILQPTTLETHPIEFGDPVAVWPNESEAIFYDEVMSAEDEAELRERLQALGYLE